MAVCAPPPRTAPSSGGGAVAGPSQQRVIPTPRQDQYAAQRRGSAPSSSIPSSASLPSFSSPSMLPPPFPTQDSMLAHQQSMLAHQQYLMQQQAAAAYYASQQPNFNGVAPPGGGYHPYRRSRAPSGPASSTAQQGPRPFTIADVDNAYNSLEHRRRTSSFHSSPVPPLLTASSFGPPSPISYRPAREMPPPMLPRSRTQSDTAVPPALPRSRRESSNSTASMPRSASDRSITPTQGPSRGPVVMPPPRSATPPIQRSPMPPAARSSSSQSIPRVPAATKAPSPLSRSTDAVPPSRHTPSSSTGSSASAISAVQPAPPVVVKPKGFAKFKQAFTSSPSSSQMQSPAQSASSASSETSRASSSPPRTPPAGPATPLPPRNRLGIFSNAKFNSSSDNLSVSSTMSSASVMLRKIGSGLKIGKRASLAGLSSVFKPSGKSSSDATSEMGVPGSTKLSKKDRKAQKGAAAAPSMAHVNAEVDRTATAGDGMTPAAALARHHQLQYAEQERVDATFVPDSMAHRIPRSKSAPILPNSDFGTLDLLDPTASPFDDEEDENTTIDERTPRQSLVEDSNFHTTDPESYFDAEDYRTASEDTHGEYDGSVFRARALAAQRTPTGELRKPRSILKNARSFNQEDFLPPQRPYARDPRMRSNSHDVPQQPTHRGTGEKTTLVQLIPSTDQIDGVVGPHPHAHEGVARPPPFAHPTHNTSMPSLAQHHQMSRAPVAMRSVTAPPTEKRRCTFANNLSVHTTWPAAVYDRRGEPATCNRLTPELAQRIKEELNAFKMHDMPVHHDSRVHTHFFV